MKRIIGIFIVISFVGVGSVYALTVTGDQGVTVTSGRTLTIAVPAAITHALTAPLATGTETIASGQSVVLEGNDFDNGVGASLVPYITVAMTGTVTNAEIKLTSIALSKTGTVTHAAAPADITLSGTAQNYAVPDVAQSSTYGELTGSHNLVINKLGPNVPAGSYSLTITYTGKDGGA